MAFEKSGCLQLTQEELILLNSITKGQRTDLIKASAALDRIGLSLDELEKILDAGEYRVVED